MLRLAHFLTPSIVLCLFVPGCGNDGGSDTSEGSAEGTTGTESSSSSGETVTASGSVTTPTDPSTTTDSTTATTTETTTGTGETSATSGTDTGTGVCMPMEADNPCRVCTKANCCPQVTTCLMDVDCACFAFCVINDGGDPPDCAMGCGIARPGQNGAIVDLLQCVEGPCADGCSG